MADAETTARPHHKNHPSIKELSKSDRGHGKIHDLGRKYGVVVEWNPRMSKDRAFCLHISGASLEAPIKLYLDLDELMWYTRMV